jgi:hypothetical protein
MMLFYGALPETTLNGPFICGSALENGGERAET